MTAWRLRLVARTPVQVGGSHVLERDDYVVEGDRLHVISSRRLVQWLERRQLVEPFLAMAGQGGAIAEFLRAHGGLAEAANLAQYTVRWEGDRPQAGVRTLARDAFHRPYIPGSSVKGALRTAILGARLDAQRQTLLRAVTRAIELTQAHAPRRRRIATQAATELEAEQFRVLRWPGHPSDRSATLLHRDVWRAVKVADGDPLPADAVRVYPVGTWSLRRDGTAYQKALQPAECIVPGTQLAFDLTFDTRLLEREQRVAPETLSKALSAWSHRQWQAEGESLARFGAGAGPLAALARFYVEEAPADLRLGWGSGWLGLTVGSLLESEERLRMRDAFFGLRDGPHFPKSRRLLVHTGRGVLPLGWLAARLEST
jgi:CRISPR-associated protein Csm5